MQGRRRLFGRGTAMELRRRFPIVESTSGGARDIPLGKEGLVSSPNKFF